MPIKGRSIEFPTAHIDVPTFENTSEHKGIHDKNSIRIMHGYDAQNEDRERVRVEIITDYKRAPNADSPVRHTENVDVYADGSGRVHILENSRLTEYKRMGASTETLKPKEFIHVLEQAHKHLSKSGQTTHLEMLGTLTNLLSHFEK